MSDAPKTVQMAIVNPGEAAGNGDFTFSMQPRFDAKRTVQYALAPADAEALHRTLGAFLKVARV